MSDLGDMLIEGLREAVEHARGKKTGAQETVVMASIPAKVDVARIRKRLGLSRAKFAIRYGFSVKTVTKWETGERQPTGPSRTLLTIIDRAPEAVEKALSAA